MVRATFIGSPNPVSMSTIEGSEVTREMARPRWAISVSVIRPISGSPRSAERFPPEMYTPSNPNSSISMATMGEKAPGKRSGRPLDSSARNRARISPAEVSRLGMIFLPKEK